MALGGLVMPFGAIRPLESAWYVDLYHKPKPTGLSVYPVSPIPKIYLTSLHLSALLL